MSTGAVIDPREVLERGDELRRDLGEDFRDQMVSSLYTEAQRIADDEQTTEGPNAAPRFVLSEPRASACAVFRSLRILNRHGGARRPGFR